MDKQTLIQTEKRGGITAQERLCICRPEKLLERILMNVYNSLTTIIRLNKPRSRASKGLEAYPTRLLVTFSINVQNECIDYTSV